MPCKSTTLISLCTHGSLSNLSCVTFVISDKLTACLLAVMMCQVKSVCKTHVGRTKMQFFGGGVKSEFKIRHIKSMCCDWAAPKKQCVDNQLREAGFCAVTVLRLTFLCHCLVTLVISFLVRASNGKPFPGRIRRGSTKFKF